MTTEADLKKEIVAYLKSVGAWYDNPVRNGYGRRGVPDIIVCYRGRFFGIEAKRPPEPGRKDPVPDAWQKRELDAILAAGGRAIVAWSVEQVKAEIEAIDDEIDDGPRPYDDFGEYMREKL